MYRIGLLLCTLGLLGWSGCAEEDPVSSQLEDHDPATKLTVSGAVAGSCERCSATRMSLELSGLEDLGPDAKYEGWVIVDGSPVSTGLFSVNSSGSPSRTGFYVDSKALRNATTFVLTIEPVPDADPAPSAVHILAGDFDESDAALSVGHPSALGDDFSAAAGQFILATPTDDDGSNENSGLWFLAGGQPTLVLPTLPAGWLYEGWAVIDGTPVTTGTFTSAEGSDMAAPYSGPNPGPAFPGEDFLVNAPAGVTFPTDLAGGTAVISIEPSPDNSSAPFTLKPLVGAIPSDATNGTPYDMDLNLASFPSGTASR